MINIYLGELNKKNLYDTVRPTILYGLECRVIKKVHKIKLHRAKIKILTYMYQKN